MPRPALLYSDYMHTSSRVRKLVSYQAYSSSLEEEFPIRIMAFKKYLRGPKKSESNRQTVLHAGSDTGKCCRQFKLAMTALIPSVSHSSSFHLLPLASASALASAFAALLAFSS